MIIIQKALIFLLTTTNKNNSYITPKL